MQGPTVPLSETHGLAVLHEAAVIPETIVKVLSVYGSVSSSSSFVLENDALMTLLFFGEPHCTDLCYQSLQAGKHTNLRVRKVGWVNENAVAQFGRKPYVRGKWNPTTPTSATPSEESGYLIVFWRAIPLLLRDNVVQVAKRYGTKVFSDEQEGGRLFVCLPESMTEDCRLAMVSAGNLSTRDISYGDVSDFAAAHKKAGLL